jgi:hypothetical protein
VRTTGTGNTCVGDSSLPSASSSTNCSALGYGAGSGVTTNSNCTYIGYQTTGTAAAVNETVIGANVTGSGSNSITARNFACITLTITASTAYTAINLTSVNGTNLFGTNCRSYIVTIGGTLVSNGTIYMIVLQPSSGTSGNLSSQFITTPNAITNYLSNSGSANTTGSISSSTIWLYVTDTLGSTYNVTFMRIGI